ncbi:MAG TPA: ABC transporter permease [Blastocatellia bacterium]|nr:ABC transporter permease [Blastocatellia bacterium]
MKLSQSFRAVSVGMLALISGCALMPKRPPYPDPERLVSVVKVAPAGEGPILGTDFLALRSESKTLGPIAAHLFRGRILTGGSESERIQSELVSADFFPALGVQPVLGRVFLSEDCKPGSNHVAVISYGLWQRRFSGDPSMIGRTITLDQERYTVVGVMPHEFQFPKECDVWMPLAFDNESFQLGAKSPELEVIARLKPGITLDEAQTEVSVIARKLEVDHPENNAGRDIKLTALRENSSQKENVKGTVLEIKIRRPANPPVETGKEK